MSVQEIYTTLHDLLVRWLTDAGFREEYDGDLERALDEHDFDHVDADDILACLPLVAEDLPPVYQQAIYEHMSAMSETDGGSYFNVDQGGGEYGAVQENGGGGGGVGGWGSGKHGGGRGGRGGEGGEESQMDAVVRHIQHIQNITENNYSYIDDSGDVTTSVTALGDVDFDQIVASGAGAVAAEGDVEGVNTGTNYGVIAGDDAKDVEVTSVFGDGNVTGEFGDDATVVAGDDNVLAKDSTVIDGDFEGGFIGGDVAANQSALNFGDGDIGQDNSVDNSKHAKDSFNTDNSVEDSGNTTVKDSFQDNDEHKYTDNSDNSTNTDLDVKVEDSFQDNDELKAVYEDNDSYSYEEKNYTKTDVDVEVEDSFNEDDGGHDGGHHGGHDFHGG
jgi:hypothetical protein